MAFNLQLEQAEVQTVFNALGALPFNTVAQLIAKLGTQVQEQQAKAQADAAQQAAEPLAEAA